MTDRPLTTLQDWQSWTQTLAEKYATENCLPAPTQMTSSDVWLFSQTLRTLEKLLQSPTTLIRPLRCLFLAEEWNPLGHWLSERSQVQEVHLLSLSASVSGSEVDTADNWQSLAMWQEKAESAAPVDLLVWWNPALTEETTAFLDSWPRLLRPQCQVLLAFSELTTCFDFASLQQSLQQHLPNLASPFAGWKGLVEAEDSGVMVPDLDKLTEEGAPCLLSSRAVESFLPAKPLHPYENNERVRTRYHLKQNHRGPTCSELLQLPSARKPQTASELTAVITVFRKNPEFLIQQLETLMQQSAPPEEIWVCAWASPREDEYRQIVHSYKSRFPALYWFSSDFPLKYFGRFQIALQARTRYTVFLDDDVNPGRLFFELCLHTIQTQDYRGLLSVKGWQLPATKQDSSLPLHTEAGVWLPTPSPPEGTVEHLTEMDMVGGLWFLETDWLRFCFREAPVTWETAEDFHFSYALRKYAGVRSYLMPMNKDNPDTWGLSATYEEMSSDQPTTVGEAHLLRERVSQRLFARGNVLQWTRSRTQSSGILALCDSVVDFQTFQPLLAELSSQLRVGVGTTGREKSLSSLLFEEEGVDWLPSSHRFDLQLYSVAGNEIREAEVWSRCLLELSSLLEMWSPTVLLVPDSLQTIFPLLAMLTDKQEIRVLHWSRQRHREERTTRSGRRFGAQKQRTFSTRPNAGRETKDSVAVFEKVSGEELGALWSALPPIRGR